MENIMLRIGETLIHPNAENVVSISGKSIDFGIQRRAEIRRQRCLVIDCRDHRELIGQWCQSFGLNTALIHEARVVVTDLLRDASLHRLRCSGLLNEVANALAGSRDEDCPRVEAWLA